MKSGVLILTVPDALGGSVLDVDALHALADRREPAEGFVLDMSRVGFVKPHGLVALLLTARRLAALCGRRIELANMGLQIHSYLERMDLFEVGGDCPLHNYPPLVMAQVVRVRVIGVLVSR